jgi:hypothetical protein|tara:strand:+ start:18790 stop:19074 length:285 start_codon:yes stop_codon:yes gene_type:complete
MIDGRYLKNMTCVHSKHFNSVGLPEEGTIVNIYYKYDQEYNQLLIDDYSIQLVVDGIIGCNVANKNNLISDYVYEFFFKTTYMELLKYVLTQIK